MPRSDGRSYEQHTQKNQTTRQRVPYAEDQLGFPQRAREDGVEGTSDDLMCDILAWRARAEWQGQTPSPSRESNGLGGDRAAPIIGHGTDPTGA